MAVTRKKIIGIRSRFLNCGQEKNGPKLMFIKNMNIFVKEFNEKTKELEKKQKVVTVKFTSYSDNSFTYKIQGVPTSILLKEAIQEKKEITENQLKKIAEQVLVYLNTDDISKACKILAGTAKSGGIKIVC